MKKHLKKLLFVVSCLGFIFSGCEKDLYENPIKDTSSVSIGKVNTVSINEVPFLIPQLVKYNSRYSHLLNPDSQNSYRGIEDLDLELERILEYAETNGLKSYSIAIKNQSDSSDDMYFENLHIIYVDGEYKPFIARYNATDDSEKFDVATFSGRIKLFSVDKLTVGSLYFENGQKLPDPAPYNPLDGDIGIGGGGDPPSWMPDWLANIFYHWNGNYLGSNSSSSSSSSSSSGNSGTGVYILGTGYTNVGSTTNTPTVNTSGSSGSGTNSTGVAPNEPEWTYPLTSQHAMANKIRSRLIYSNPEIEPWLENPSNLGLVDQIYFYMAEGGNDSETNNVASTALVQMIASPGVFSSMTPFIIENKIDDIDLDPCSKGILNQLKNLQQNDIAKMLSRFGSYPSIYNLKFKTTEPISPINSAETDWERNSNDVAIDYHYLIKIKPLYKNYATKIAIARTLLHEMIHAYILSAIDDLNMNSNINPKDFPMIYNALLNQTYDNNPNQLQHMQMARKFVEALRDALKELDGSSQPLQYYEDLAWGGLDQTSIFNTMFPIGSENRDRILATNAAEDHNNTFVIGSVSKSPLSPPCN